MMNIHCEYIGKFILIYLNDIIVYSDPLGAYVCHVAIVLDLLDRYEYYLNPKKCQFLCDEFELLGHQISRGIIRPLRSRIERIRDRPLPKNTNGLRKFLGIINYFHAHLPRLATLAGPLYEISGRKGNQPINWTHTTSKVFQQIKALMDNCVTLQPPNYVTLQKGETKIFLTTDASRVGLGAVLTLGPTYEQSLSCILRLFSKKFTPTQMKYPTRDLELLAIVDAVCAFRHYLIGITFTIRTDHKTLIYLTGMRLERDRHYRWIDDLSAYDSDIIHLPGTKNFLADYLSRIYEDIEGSEIQKEDYAQQDPITNLRSTLERDERLLTTTPNNLYGLENTDTNESQQPADTNPECFLTTSSRIPANDSKHDQPRTDTNEGSAKHIQAHVTDSTTTAIPGSQLSTKNTLRLSLQELKHQSSTNLHQPMPYYTGCWPDRFEIPERYHYLYLSTPILDHEGYGHAVTSGIYTTDISNFRTTHDGRN